MIGSWSNSSRLPNKLVVNTGSELIFLITSLELGPIHVGLVTQGTHAIIDTFTMIVPSLLCLASHMMFLYFSFYPIFLSLH